jgi:hypothetical protein
MQPSGTVASSASQLPASVPWIDLVDGNDKTIQDRLIVE